MENQREKRESEKLTDQFFRLRFPDRNVETEKLSGYFYEWVHRFNQVDPTIYMDSQSLAVYRKMVNEK